MVCGYTNTTGGLPTPTPSVYTTLNGGGTWTAAAKQPTGGVSRLTDPVLSPLVPLAPLCYVMMTGVGNAFGTTGAAIVGTQGVDCGLSGTIDFGNTFNTFCPNTTISGGVTFTSTNLTVVPQISPASDGTIYETSFSSGSGASATATETAGAVTSITITAPGMQYMYPPAITFTGGGGSGASATAVINTFGQVTGYTGLSGGSGYTSNPTGVVLTPAAKDMEYSAWRYYAANSAWDRINSWSLYSTGVYTMATFNPVAFNMISTTPAQDAAFLSDNLTNQIYRSINKGQTWMQWGQQIPTTNGPTSSWLVINGSTVLIGTVGLGGNTGGVIWTTSNGVVWLQRQAFANQTVAVTSIALAPNGDYLAAGVDAAGDINIASSSNEGVSWTSNDEGNDIGTGIIKASTAAYISAAADYATSKIVYFGGNGTNPSYNGIWYGTILGPSVRADASANWVQQGTDAITGLVTAAGGPGFPAEGTGMAYADSPTGVIRVKGRVSGGTAAAELIPGPIGVTLSGLNVSANGVGNVTLYAVGNDENIYSYTDTLNAAVSGITVSNLTTAYDTTSMTPSSATISWTAVPNATDYFVVVDTEAWTDIYDAENASAIIAASAVTSATSHTFDQKFAPNNSYYVSVWALKNNTIGELTTASSLQGANVISSFGGTIALNPPLQVPVTLVNLTPALDATISPFAPDFAWTSVSGAASYTLQITTVSDPAFAVPVYINSSVPADTGPITSYALTGTLAYATSYLWRVEANGIPASTWGNSDFSTTAAVVPPVTVTQPTTSIKSTTSTAPTPPPASTIVVTAPAQVTVTQATLVQPPVSVPEPKLTISQPKAKSPTGIWVIAGIGGLLVVGAVILVIRAHREV
jgi:hypothetical protein